MSHTSMVTEHRFASPQTNVTKQGNRIANFGRGTSGQFSPRDQSELTDRPDAGTLPRRRDSIASDGCSVPRSDGIQGFPAVPTFRMRLPCRHSNKTTKDVPYATIAYHCLPNRQLLPTLGIETLNVSGMISKLACNPRRWPTPECPACCSKYATRRPGTAPA